MYVVGLDRSWFRTPFLLHRGWIKSAEEIESLKRHGVREVVIDTTRGVDADPPAPEPAPIKTATSVGDSEAAQKAKPESRPSLLLELAFRPLVKELEAARPIHDEALALAQGILEGVGGGAALNSLVARKVVTGLLGSIVRSPEANLLLAQMRRFQNDLFTHAVNVCVLCLVIGTLDGFDNEVSALGMGALLHDVGETRIPRNLLRKTDAYTDAERRLMEQHPPLGAMILQQSENIPEAAKRIVVEHHERIDGSGYPRGLRGAEISHFSQVVGITDAYDAMLAGRNQPRLQPIEVLRQLYFEANRGAFDRELVERIIRCLGVYPIGSLVELNTGERGIVIAANRADTVKPTLRIIVSRQGLELSNGPIVSLADPDPDSGERRIVRALDPGKERVDLLAYLKLAPAVVG
jgi:HD-GYP domain-containing protein (c-di-GMP phosphodiesterase class II)